MNLINNKLTNIDINLIDDEDRSNTLSIRQSFIDALQHYQHTQEMSLNFKKFIYHTYIKPINSYDEPICDPEVKNFIHKFLPKFEFTSKELLLFSKKIYDDEIKQLFYSHISLDTDFISKTETIAPLFQELLEKTSKIISHNYLERNGISPDKMPAEEFKKERINTLKLTFEAENELAQDFEEFGMLNVFEHYKLMLKKFLLLESKLQRGACDLLSAYTFFFFCEKLKNISNIELFHIVGGAHCIVVLFRDPNSNPKKFITWNPECLIIDLWMRQMYLGKDLLTKLTAVESQQKGIHYDAKRISFNPNHHSLELKFSKVQPCRVFYEETQTKQDDRINKMRKQLLNFHMADNDQIRLKNASKIAHSTLGLKKKLKKR